MRISTRSARKKRRIREARDKEGFDPGAVIPGVQAQWIQPLTIRGNQGDCVKLKLSNKLEGGEDVSLHISRLQHGGERDGCRSDHDEFRQRSLPEGQEWGVTSGTSIPARRKASGSSTRSANDRELTVMGLFGSFVVEPRGSSNTWKRWAAGAATPATSGWQVMIKNGTGPGLPRVRAVLPRGRRRGVPPR
jgi:hypothetical protein